MHSLQNLTICQSRNESWNLKTKINIYILQCFYPPLPPPPGKNNTTAIHKINIRRLYHKYATNYNIICDVYFSTCTSSNTLTHSVVIYIINHIYYKL